MAQLASKYWTFCCLWAFSWWDCVQLFVVSDPVTWQERSRFHVFWQEATASCFWLRLSTVSFYFSCHHCERNRQGSICSPSLSQTAFFNMTQARRVITSETAIPQEASRVFTWGCTRPGREDPIAHLLISIGLDITRRYNTLLREVVQKAEISSYVFVRGDLGFLSRGRRLPCHFGSRVVYCRA